MKADYRIDKAGWEETPPEQRIGALIIEQFFHNSSGSYVNQHPEEFFVD